MSEPEGEGFLARWTRRKREAAEAGEAGPAAEAPRHAPDHAARDTPPAEGAPAPEQPTIDLSALPSIDQITATTDIRPFLAPGVPPELTRAALRRAWIADPQIRDFVGIAENQWDFTDPNAIPGFGALGPLDDIAKLVARAVGGADDVTAPVAPAPSATPKSSAEPPVGKNPTELTSGESAHLTCQQRAARAAAGEVRRDTTDAIAASSPEGDTAAGPAVPIRRGHGGALPS